MSMLRIGILTYHFADNYGAVMQAYGLSQWLASQGHDVQFVNYVPRYVESGEPFKFSLRRQAMRSNIVSLYQRYSKLVRRHREGSTADGGFASFRAQHFRIMGRPVDRIDQLNLSNRFDLLISGSDQVWNPSSRGELDPAYFLEIPGTNGCRKISYAASFGTASIDPRLHGRLGELLQGMHAISVREKSGISLVSACAGTAAVCSPDPSLLISDLTSIRAELAVEPSSYVFCYVLRSRELIDRVAQTVSNSLGTELVSARHQHQRWRPLGRQVEATPGEWISYIGKARFVVTNSFHGAVFSVLLERPFIAVSLPGSKAALSYRIRNFLQEIGLESLFVESDDPETVLRILKREIPWTEVRARVAQLRATGESYLREQISIIQREHADAL